MRGYLNVGSLGLFWAGLALAIWTLFVPAPVSVSAFAWINVAMALSIALIVMFARFAEPTRSIAHVIYDVEHPSER